MGDKKKVVFGVMVFLLIISVGVVYANFDEIICSINSDCGHDGCAGNSNYCCGNEVCQEWIFFSCNLPRTSESFCSNVKSPLMLENCTSQDLICKRGFCIPPECTQDSDCGGVSYSDNYCYEDDVVRDHMTPFCGDYECEANVETELVEDCGEDYIGEWRDDYCKDNDVHHNRTWHYKGCSIGLNVCHDNERIEEQKVETCKWGCEDGECINREIACYQNSDCGRDGFVGNDYCLFGDIYESWVDYTCYNPGTNESFCSNVTEPILMDECGFGCEDGRCVDEECGNNIVEQGEECEPPNTEICDENCQYKNLTCIEAKDLGLVTGFINGGTGTVTNNGYQPYLVGLAVYKKFDEIIDNQVLFDSDVIINPGETLELEVELPDCKYQIDLFCGEVLETLNETRYGDRLIDYEHNNTGDYCAENGCEPDVALIDFSNSIGGILLEYTNNTDILEEIPTLTCGEIIKAKIKVKNLGTCYENVTFNTSVDGIVFNLNDVPDLEPDDYTFRTSLTPYINLSLDEGFYNISVEAIINEDINLSNNFAERGIEVVCPVCAIEENETRQCGVSDVGKCQFGEQIRVCGEEGQWGNWSECVGNINPVNETCNSLDNDCDGSIDESLICEEGNCDARSKGYWKNHEGCFQGEGESLWESEVNNLSVSFFDVFFEINGSEICVFMADNCDSEMLCKAKQMLLANELNVVSDKLQLNAIVAGAVHNKTSAFSNLGLNSSSSIEQALEKVEQVISENSTQQDLEYAKDVAERIYEFYGNENNESENPDYPECLYEWDNNDNNGNSEGNGNGGNGGGGGGSSVSSYNIRFCGDDFCNEELGENEVNCPKDCKSLDVEILSYGVEDLNENIIQSEVAAKNNSKILPLALLISIFLMLFSVLAFFIIRKK